MKKLLPVVLVAILLVVLAASAAPPIVTAPTKPNQPGAEPPKSEKKARPLPFHGNVASIDKSARTITMQGKKQRLFHLTSDTKINKDRKPSSLTALAAGDYVGGSYREAADGSLELVTLNIGTAAGKNQATPQKPASK